MRYDVCMFKKLVAPFICLAIGILLVAPVHAKRYASTDLCGLTIEPHDPNGPVTGRDWDFKRHKVAKGSTELGKPVIPQAWPACVKCLYDVPKTFPATVSSEEALEALVIANIDKTLAIEQPEPKPGEENAPVNTDTGLPPAPKTGVYYTQFGCFDLGGEGSEYENPNVSANVIKRLLTMIQGVTGAIGFAYFVYGAFLVLTSQGSVDKVKAGKDAIKHAILGTIFTILSVFIVQFIAGTLLAIPGIQ